MPLYLFGEDARKFLRMQGSNLRIGDAFCVEIDECGEWYVRPVKDTIRNISGAVASKKKGNIYFPYPLFTQLKSYFILQLLKLPQ